jgi:serpin B
MHRPICLAVALASALAAQQPDQASSIIKGLEAISGTEDAAALAAALDHFGGELAAVAGKADANLCLSSASIGLCLLMTLPGARGDTAGELQRLLCPQGFDAARTTAAAHQLLDHLRGTSKIELALVNDLWPQSGHPVLSPYLDAVQRGFSAQLRPVDFKADPAAARATINAYIAKATRGHIADLLGADAVRKDTRLVLTNAIWLKADWASPFRGEDTHNGTFHLLDQKTAEVPLMHQRGTFAYAEVGGLQLLRLPYVDASFAFDIALPAAGAPLATAEKALLPAANQAMVLQPATVQVTLPRFRIEGSFNLATVLAGLGLQTATTPKADFSGIDGGNGNLYIGEVVHKTYLDVAEKGTEAAAATAVVMRAGSRPPAGPMFIADRPFAFALRDLTTGLVLFSGRVVDPRGKT